MADQHKTPSQMFILAIGPVEPQHISSVEELLEHAGSTNRQLIQLGQDQNRAVGTTEGSISAPNVAAMTLATLMAQKVGMDDLDLDYVAAIIAPDRSYYTPGTLLDQAASYINPLTLRFVGPPNLPLARVN